MPDPTCRLSEDEVRSLVEAALRSARPPMERYLGLRPRGYNAADAIAEGIDRGIRRGLTSLGLIEEES